MTKQLNTSHPLYSNIVRALTADEFINNMLAIDGGADLIAQSTNYASTEEAATWTAVQGIARNATHWFATDTAEIRRYDLVNNLLTTNASPYTSLPPGINHLGDCFVDGSFLYVPASNSTGPSWVATIMGVAKYNIADLTFDSYIDMSSETNINLSGCCLNKAGDEILVASYYDIVGSDQRNTDIYRYNLSTGAFIGIHTLSVPSIGIQGITYHSDLDAYFVSSYNSTGPINTIYWYDSSFVLKSILTPTGNTTIEMEGIEVYDGVMYYHRVFQEPQIVDPSFLNLWGTSSTSPKFLDASLMSDQATIIMIMKSQRLFDFNVIFDNLTTTTDWSSWIYGSGEFAFRVNAAERTSTAGLLANQYYNLAFTWDNQSGTVTCKTGVDGVYGAASTPAVWVTPPVNGLGLAGINSVNNGENVYTDILVFDKVLSDAELLDAYNNFDDFYTLGGDAGMVKPMISSMITPMISGMIN